LTNISYYLNCTLILYLNHDKTEILKKQGERFYGATIVVLSILVLTGVIIFQPPIQKASAQPPCSLGQVQPTDPLDMNTIIFKTIAKTIHVEKEVYSNCQGIVPSNLDVSTFTEIIENLSSFPTIVPKVSFEVITCSKNIVVGSAGRCEQVKPSNTMPSVSSCREVNVGFPIEMNTVTSPNGIVKTVQSEKEVFNCKVTGGTPPGFGSTAIKEVTIFTEIFEDLLHGKTVKMSQSTLCIKPLGPAIINSRTVSCQASRASVI
jgi:hypothetical protein